MTPEATPDPYEYSSILSIDYVIPIVQKINKIPQKKSNLTTALNIFKIWIFCIFL